MIIQINSNTLSVLRGTLNPAFKMLYIVATPIGNLKDITFRAVEILKTAEKIYCEDTRRTRILCDEYGIQTRLESFHHYSENKIATIVEELSSGTEIAYVTDAGTPGIQDPGGKLVAAAREGGVEVTPIPGPSSITAILSVAGINTESFRFVGYVPTKKGRQTFIKKLLENSEPVVFFETALRLQKFFDQVAELGGVDRQFIVGRELTKKFEEIRQGSTAELKDYFTKPLGEFVIISLPK